MNTGTTRKSQDGKWLTTKQAAEKLQEAGLNITENRLRQLRTDKRGPRFRKRNVPGSRSYVVYAASDIAKYIAQEDPANWPVTETTP